MPVKPEDRPIETLRQEVIDQLVMNYSHGELSLEAFERRLDLAMNTDQHGVLQEQVADLDMQVDEAYTKSKQEELGVQYVPGQTEESERILNIFSDNTRSGKWRLPKSMKLTSVLASTEINMMQAEFNQPVLKIKVFSVLSGDTFYVPEGVNVTSNVFSIFGSVTNDLGNSGNPNAPTVIIEGYSIFSSIDISVKRTLKEKFVEFADKMKELLG